MDQRCLGLLGVFGGGRFNGSMQNVVGPTFFAMAMKLGLGAEIQLPTGLWSCVFWLVCLWWLLWFLEKYESIFMKFGRCSSSMLYVTMKVKVIVVHNPSATSMTKMFQTRPCLNYVELSRLVSELTAFGFESNWSIPLRYLCEIVYNRCCMSIAVSTGAWQRSALCERFLVVDLHRVMKLHW